MPLTRAMSRSHSSGPFISLPDDLWVLVLSHLPPSDLGRALCVSRGLASLSDDAWRAACFRRWPRWAAIAAEPGQLWRRQYELLSLRESEGGCLPDLPAIKKLQQAVTERHRAILTEWLCEVSTDWDIDSSIVFKAVAYLDAYLQRTNVEALSRFQLLGLGCLRAAMGDARKVHKVDGKYLDAALFAYISDDTYTPAEVEESTQVVTGVVPAYLKTSPNAKMFLRTFWYRATLHEVVTEAEMHIYTLASFLLQLSLLDLACSAWPPSMLAAAALSVSLGTYGKAEWPLALQRFGSYTAEELGAAKARLAELQATQEAAQLRTAWRARNENHSYQEHKEEWDHLLLLCSCRSRLAPFAPRAPGGGGSEPATPALVGGDGPEMMQVD